MTIDPSVLIFITFVGAFVNGALSYGFSSITLPVALIYYTNKVLNPALVLVEIILNGHVLLIHRNSLTKVWRRIFSIFLGLIPMIFLGSYLLVYVRPDWLKLFIYLILVPLILCQAAGVRWPIRSEKKFLPLLGAGVGLLYSLTTISGPPIALFLNNQGFTKNDFKAALSFIRLVQAVLTGCVYLYLGFYQKSHLVLSGLILPGICLATLLGSVVIRNVKAETFRRIAMSFDSWIVSFGLARLMIQLHFLNGIAYYMMSIVIVIDLILLSSYFVKNKNQSILFKPDT